MNSTGQAVGEIYIDDGVSASPNATRFVALAIENNTLRVSTTGNYSVAEPLGNLTILGLSLPSSVMFSGGGAVNWTWSNDILTVNGVGNTSAWNSPWTLSWK